MGFKDAMKAANFNFGTVDSPDFMTCYLAQKDDHFMITGAQSGTYEFRREDVVEFRPIATGETWIKWKMTFKDGKYAIVTSPVKVPGQQGSGMSMAPIERFFGDKIVAKKTKVTTTQTTTRVTPTPVTPTPTETPKEEVKVEETPTKVEEAPKVEVNTQKDDEAIAKLKELLDMGVITQKEYEKKKSQIINHEAPKDELEPSPVPTQTYSSSNSIILKILRVFEIIFPFVAIVMFIIGACFLVLPSSICYESYDGYQHSFVGLLNVIRPETYCVWLIVELALIFAAMMVLYLIWLFKKPGHKTWRIIFSSIAFFSMVGMMLECYFMYSVGPYDVYVLVAGIMFSVSTGFALADFLVSIFRKGDQKTKLGLVIPLASIGAIIPVLAILLIPSINGKNPFEFTSGGNYGSTSYALNNSRNTWLSNNNAVNHCPEGGTDVNNCSLVLYFEDGTEYEPMYTNPASETSPYGVDTACYLSIILSGGDEFNILYYSSTYSWEYIEGEQFVIDSCFVRDVGHNAIRCRQAGIYNIYLNNSNHIWIEAL